MSCRPKAVCCLVSRFLNDSSRGLSTIRSTSFFWNLNKTPFANQTSHACFVKRDTVMKMSWKLLRQSCAIMTSGAVVFSWMPATAQQPSPPEQSPPQQQSEQPAAQPLGQAQLETLVAPIA